MTTRTMRSPQEGSAYPKCRNVCRIVFLPRHWQSCLLVKKYGLPAIWHSSSTGLFTTEYRHGDVPWQMKQCGTQKSSGVRCIFLECDDTDTARRFTKQTEKKKNAATSRHDANSHKKKHWLCKLHFTVLAKLWLLQSPSNLTFFSPQCEHLE